VGCCRITSLFVYVTLYYFVVITLVLVGLYTRTPMLRRHYFMSSLDCADATTPVLCMFTTFKAQLRKMTVCSSISLYRRRAINVHTGASIPRSHDATLLLPCPPRRSRLPLLRLGGMGERFSFPSGFGRSPAAKRYLVNFRLKI